MNLKIKILSFLLILSTLNCLAGDKSGQDWFSLGVKAGYTYTLEKRTPPNAAYFFRDTERNGGNLGLMLRLGRSVYCQAEANYTLNTFSSYRELNNYDTVAQELLTHTIDVPVLLGYNIVHRPNFKLRVLGGPSFSFNVNRQEKNNPIQAPEGSPFVTGMRQTRVGFELGIGFDFWRITLDARYLIIQDVYRYRYNQDNMSFKAIPYPNNTFNITIGYLIVRPRHSAKKK